MKIAFDLSSLASSKSGIPRVNLNLLLNLNIKKENIHIFSFSRINIEELNNFKKINFFAPFPVRYLRFIWYNFIFPFQLNIKKIDYLICHQRAPLLSFGYRIVLILHDFTYINQPQSMKFTNYLLDKYFVPYFIKKSELIISGTHAIKKELLNRFPITKNKSHVIYWGSFFKKNNLKIDKKKNNFLHVGSFEPRKNIINLLLAYSKLDQNLKEKHNLYLVGSDTWGNENLEKIIKKLKLENFVKIYKNISDKKLEKLYLTSFYLILISKYEGYGLPIIEALSCLTPTIVSKNESLLEVNNKCGLEVDSEDIMSIKNVLHEACVSEETYNNLLIKIEKRKLPTYRDAGEKLTKLLIENYVEK